MSTRQVIATDVNGNSNGNGEANQHQIREHSHYAKISENAKGEPSVTVSVSADDRYEVHDEIMSLYQMVKESLSLPSKAGERGDSE